MPDESIWYQQYGGHAYHTTSGFTWVERPNWPLPTLECGEERAMPDTTNIERAGTWGELARAARFRTWTRILARAGYILVPVHTTINRYNGFLYQQEPLMTLCNLMPGLMGRMRNQNDSICFTGAAKVYATSVLNCTFVLYSVREHWANPISMACIAETLNWAGPHISHNPQSWQVIIPNVEGEVLISAELREAVINMRRLDVTLGYLVRPESPTDNSPEEAAA